MFCAQSESSGNSQTEGVDGRGSRAQRVKLATCDSDDLNSNERFHESGPRLVLAEPVAEAAVLSAAPRKHTPSVGDGGTVELAAGQLLDNLSVETATDSSWGGG